MNPTDRLAMQERWSAFACCVVATLLWIGPWIVRQDLYYDDAAHHVWWLYQYADPALFPGDIAVAYFKTSATWGWRLMTHRAPGRRWMRALFLATRARGESRTHSSSRASCRRFELSCFSPSASRACFCSSQDE